MNKLLILFALAVFSATAIPSLKQELIQEYIDFGLQELEHKFGARWFKGETDDGTLSVVHWPEFGALSEPEILKKVYHHLANSDKPDYFNLSDAKLEVCDRGLLPDYWKFFGDFIGQLNTSNTEFSYESPCFSSNNFQLNFIDETTVEVVHTANHHDHIFCGDGYFLSTMQNFHISIVNTKGTHKTVFTNLSAYDIQVIQESGIFIYRYCDRVLNVIPDIFLTALMFLGGLGKNPNLPLIGTHPNLLQEELARDFIYQATGYFWEKRPSSKYVELDHTLIKSGDFFAVTRFIGNDAAIELGSGSRVGHSTMALWVDDELYILESQGGAWPKQGIQMNPYDTWMQWAQNAGYMVTWLPLKAEYSAKFNATACYEWFLTVVGQPYGYEAFLWGWIDTVNASYPALMSNQYLASFFAFAESRIPGASKMFNPGLNFRLGTENLSVSEMALLIAERNLTFPELYAIPEIDGTIYDGHYSYVCSAMVVGLYKAGGLFEGLTINAVEWTPRDIYQSVLIDPNPPVPDNCKEVDPTNPYCQIMGAWRMTFQDISTVDLYSNMNEHCPSMPPLYERTPGC